MHLPPSGVGSRRAWLLVAVLLAAVSASGRRSLSGPTSSGPHVPQAALGAAGFIATGPVEPAASQTPAPVAAFRRAFERGVAAYNTDDLDSATDAFEEAVRLAPEDAEARVNLGLLYLRLRRSDDGLRELARGAALAAREPRVGVSRRAPGSSATIDRVDGAAQSPR